MGGESPKAIVNDLPISKSAVYRLRAALRKVIAPAEQRGPADQPTGGA